MRFLLLLVSAISLSTYFSYSQEVISLWSELDPPIISDSLDEAKLYVYLPDQKDSVNRPCILIFPGGGYAGVGMKNEGHAFAKWLSSEGFVCFVLKYRLPNNVKEIPFDDAQESLKIISENANRLYIDLSRIGIAGFSAGGHLAAIFSNNLVKQSNAIQPAFNVLFYPVITFSQLTKGGTRSRLLGLNPSAEEIRKFSAELQVSSSTPQTIILLSDNDESVPSVHSSMYYEALKEKNIPAAMYVFPTGGHGWAMQDDFEYNRQALSLLSSWLNNFR